MNKTVLKQLKGLRPGDLVRVEWDDASVGKSLFSGSAVDVHVKSWGVFVAVLGKRKKHLVLCGNEFQFSEDLYDVDYTAIPLSWVFNITVRVEQEISSDEASLLLKSFLSGQRRTLKRRVRNHEKLR